MGYRVIRFNNEQVLNNTEKVLEVIDTHIEKLNIPQT
jgi:very-short-patch-repair endonuclease